MLNSKDFTLLVAGPCHDNLAKMVSFNSEAVDRVVFSGWEDDAGLKRLSDLGVCMVLSPMPLSDRLERLHNSQNIYLQATTVLAGLELVKTPYVIKARSDEFFTDLSLMIDGFDPERLLSSNIFVRDVSYRPFHFSDHLFVGRSDRLRDAFRSLKEYIEINSDGRDFYGLLNDLVPAEVKIALFYLRSCGYGFDELLSCSNVEAYNIMRREFDVFDVDSLRPFEISSSVAGKIHNYRRFVFRDALLGLRYISSIDQMGPQGALARLFVRVLSRAKRALFLR